MDHLDVGITLEEVAEDFTTDCRGLVDATAVGATQVVVCEQRRVLDRYGHMVHVNGDAAFVQSLKKLEKIGSSR